MTRENADVEGESVQVTSAIAFADHLRWLADELEGGRKCNGEVWERLYQDGPAGPIDYTPGVENGD